jgi:hypothetical protein
MNILKKFIFKCDNLERLDWWADGVGRRDDVAAFIYVLVAPLGN